MYLDFEKMELMFPETDYKSLNGLSLAFIGDAVYELFIRKYVLSKGEMTVKQLHNASIKYVNADFQADMADFLADVFTEEEAAIFRRGKNSQPGHIPKNKSKSQYNKATGFEAVIGYLYLKKEYERLRYIFSLIIKKEEENG